MIQMKKAFAWNWVISGLIIGLVVITIFTSMLNKVFIENARQDADKQFSEIYVRINTLCTASVGEEDLYKLKIPDIVEGIYISDNNKVFPEDFDDKVKKRETFIGSYLCMKLKEEKQKCRRLKYEIEMSYFGQKKTVISLADKILKRSTYTTYPTYFIKNECGVSVLADGVSATLPETACIPIRCNYTLLMACDKQPASVLLNSNMVLLADSTPILDNTSDTPIFLKNVANFFKGPESSILMVWEDEEKGTWVTLGYKKMLTDEGFTVNAFRRTGASRIQAATVNGYDQVWIFRPGWCGGETSNGQPRTSATTSCIDFQPWIDTEFNVLKNYLDNGGKILLTSDYSSLSKKYRTPRNILQNINMPQNITNNIIAAATPELYFGYKGCYCGCGKSSKTDIIQHPITNSVENFRFGASTSIVCY
ncbi:MAG: hypothetical protein U9Q92_05475 [archaeon]|nr:hypothetical protein [archaeon]